VEAKLAMRVQLVGRMADATVLWVSLHVPMKRFNMKAMKLFAH